MGEAFYKAGTLNHSRPLRPQHLKFESVNVEVAGKKLNQLESAVEWLCPNGEVEADEEIADEVILPAPIADPGQPTAEEVSLHEMTHCPFEKWCSHCVRGQAPEDPHRKVKPKDKVDVEDREESLPKVAMDYCFMGSKGLIKMGSLTEGTGKEGDGIEAKDNPILVMHDSKSGMAFTYVVHKKGSYEAIVRAVSKDLDRLGYKQLILKRDQENSIEELAMKVKAYWSGEAIPERSPVGESQSNARVERCIRTIGGRIRTLKDALEFKLKCIIPAEHPMMQWLVKWASLTHNVFQVKRNGKRRIKH